MRTAKAARIAAAIHKNDSPGLPAAQAEMGHKRPWFRFDWNIGMNINLDSITSPPCPAQPGWYDGRFAVLHKEYRPCSKSSQELFCLPPPPLLLVHSPPAGYFRCCRKGLLPRLGRGFLCFRRESSAGNNQLYAGGRLGAADAFPVPLSISAVGLVRFLLRQYAPQEYPRVGRGAVCGVGAEGELCRRQPGPGAALCEPHRYAARLPRGCSRTSSAEFM